jgi:hypothetical protein
MPGPPKAPAVTSDYGDAVAAALHAEAEEARAEIRAAGIVCPSCGVNMADLPDSHRLVLDPGGIDWERAVKRPPSALCASGELVSLDGASFETWQAAANVSLYDDFRARFDEALFGTGPANFTGLLGGTAGRESNPRAR